jgi:hypothetical protein
MKKALKLLGLVVLLLIFWLAGELIASFVIGSSIVIGLLLTAIPALIFGFIIGLAVGKRWWLGGGIGALGFVTGAIFGFSEGTFTIFERLVSLTVVPIICAFLGGWIGGRTLRQPDKKTEVV